jgi:predicted extracellular nuclease
VLGYVANNTVAIQDATGGISVYNNGGLADLAALIGHEVEVIGVRGAFGGLIQLTNYTFEDLGEEDLPAAFDLQTLDEWNATTLVPYRTTRVSAANLKITAWTDANHGNIEMTLLDETTGNTLNFKWDSRVDIAERTFLEATKLGDYVTFTGAVLGWASNNPLLTLSHGSQISAGTAPVLTDANFVILDAKAIDIETSYTAAGDIVLPATGANSTAIAWSFTDAEDADNALIDLVELTVALPADVGTVEVSLTATVTKGEASTTKAFVISIQKLPEPTGEAELFFSEYVEGSSNNKYIEIYNPTDADVDLSGYSIALFSNGSTTATPRVLSGTLASGDVYVIANSQANATILAAADIAPVYVSGQFQAAWNGDDAVVLYKGETIIDIILSIGHPADQKDLENMTLVRKPAIIKGSTTFNLAEWNQLAIDTFTDLGVHTSDAPEAE